MNHHLRFRQIHLDFHTSPHIPGIGEKFNKKEYQETLRKNRVNSITTFASGHHGWSYYDTKIGKRHPNLKFDLLRAQFDACKEIDVNVPIYMTAGVHNMMAEENPGWREVNEKGQYSGWAGNLLQAGFKKMCFNTPYLDYLCEQIKEVVRLFPNCDGIFLDIISQGPCCCEFCIRSMLAKGFDPEKPEDRKNHATQVLENYYKRTTEAAKCDDPDMPVFHNSGHITIGQTGILQYFSHLELESLPTGGWGYDHFPISAKYCQKLDKDFLGMSGKFHTTWGEFGGYKHPNALRYECAAMLAFGSKCSIGDQLHPNGQIDASTYEIIGTAYKEVEEKESWCDDTVNVVDIALLSSIATNPDGPRESAGDTGAARILLEGHFLFDIIDAEMDFSGYKMMLLPDNVKINATLKKKLDQYLKKGGKLMLTAESGLNEAGTEFLFDVGAESLGRNEYDPDYLIACDELQPSFTSSPLVMYGGSNQIKVTSGQSLGKVCNSYFNRSYKHFCSHQHTPNNTDDCENDCGVINGNILYLAHPVFSVYRGLGAVAYKEYALKAINKLLGDDNSLKTNMPSTARVSIMEQPEEKRYILHLLFANTVARGGALQMSGGNLRSSARSVEVIEELMPLYNTSIEIKPQKEIKEITLEPQGEKLPFEIKDGKVSIQIPEFTCHQMIVMHY